MIDVTDWKLVARALLGSWPQQVAAWGPEAITAWCQEVAARGVTPEMALVAIRCCPASQRFPPSAAELAGMATLDPSLPSWDEAWVALVRAMRRSPEAAALAWLERETHPWVAAFMRVRGWQELRMTPFFDVDHGHHRVRDLQRAWEVWVARAETRQRAGLPIEQAASRAALTRGPRRLDALAALAGAEPAPVLSAATTGTHKRSPR